MFEFDTIFNLALLEHRALFVEIAIFSGFFDWSERGHFLIFNF